MVEISQEPSALFAQSLTGKFVLARALVKESIFDTLPSRLQTDPVGMRSGRVGRGSARAAARDAVRRRRTVSVCLFPKSAKRDASPTLRHAPRPGRSDSTEL